MTPVEFEPTISAGERPKTYALDRAATGTSSINYVIYKIVVYAATHIAHLISPPNYKVPDF